MIIIVSRTVLVFLFTPATHLYSLLMCVWNLYPRYRRNLYLNRQKNYKHFHGHKHISHNPVPNYLIPKLYSIIYIIMLPVIKIYLRKEVPRNRSERT